VVSCSCCSDRRCASGCHHWALRRPHRPQQVVENRATPDLQPVLIDIQISEPAPAIEYPDLYWGSDLLRPWTRCLRSDVLRQRPYCICQSHHIRCSLDRYESKRESFVRPEGACIEVGPRHWSHEIEVVSFIYSIIV